MPETVETQPFTIRLPHAEHEALKHLAGFTGDSMQLLLGSMVRTELRRWFDLYKNVDSEPTWTGNDEVSEAHRRAFLAVLVAHIIENPEPGR